MPFLLLFGLLLAIGGCSRGEAPEEGVGAVIGVPPGTAAEYERRLVFLAALADPPLAAVFDFRVVTGGVALERAARGWLANEHGWDPLLEAEWSADPIRDPWRLVPHGPLRLVIGDADELEALVHRDPARPVRLEPGGELGAWSPGPGGQVRVQRARLRVDGGESIGALLDIQLGRRLRGAARAEADGAADVVAGNLEAFLTDGEDVYVVLLVGPERTLTGWVRRGADEMVLERVQFEATESLLAGAVAPGGEPAAADFAVPVAWRVRATRGALVGELRSESRALVEPNAGRVREAKVLHLVEGWVELGGERRPVFGHIRHGSG